MKKHNSLAKIKTAPFIHTEKTTTYLEIKEIIALLPCVVYSVFAYGLKALLLIVFSVLVSLGIDALATELNLVPRMNIKGDKFYFDFSAIYVGIIFALLLPPYTSLYVAFCGLSLGVFLTKSVMGGRGTNIFNPALVGRLFVEMLFPDKVTLFAQPGRDWFLLDSLFDVNYQGYDMISFSQQINDYSFIEILSGRFPGYIGIGCSLVVLIGLAYIFASRDFKISSSVSYLITVFFVGLLSGIGTDVKVVALYLLSSGVLFVAAYLLTDYVTCIYKGIYGVLNGVLCGILFVFLSRFLSGILPVIAPVLICNLVSYFLKYIDISNIHAQRKGET